MNLAQRRNYAGDFLKIRSVTPKDVHYKPLSFDKSKSKGVFQKTMYFDLSKIQGRSEKQVKKNRIFTTSHSPRRPVKTENLTSLINKIVNKSLGIRFRDEQCSPDQTKTAKFFQLKERKMKLKLNNQEQLDFIIDPEYYKPEYLSYLTDVGNNIKMEKYICQSLVKKRKQARFLNGFNKIL